MNEITKVQDTLVTRLEILTQTVREQPLEVFLKELLGLTADMIAVVTLSSKQLDWPRDICDAIYNDAMEMVVQGLKEEGGIQ